MEMPKKKVGEYQTQILPTFAILVISGPQITAVFNWLEISSTEDQYPKLA